VTRRAGQTGLVLLTGDRDLHALLARSGTAQRLINGRQNDHDLISEACKERLPLGPEYVWFQGIVYRNVVAVGEEGASKGTAARDRETILLLSDGASFLRIREARHDQRTHLVKLDVDGALPCLAPSCCQGCLPRSGGAGEEHEIGLSHDGE
jgi:hypothetical protein